MIDIVLARRPLLCIALSGLDFNGEFSAKDCLDVHKGGFLSLGVGIFVKIVQSLHSERYGAS